MSATKGFNITRAYGRNAAKTDKVQQRIAGIENGIQKSILGDSRVPDQDQLRDAMQKMKALLAELRIRAHELVQEQLEQLKARKALLDIVA